ncbi:MAG TPA: preprotein translocase subunit YajC [Isosphaeraceae bacterium]|jgi:preprotein translocase subunit YajC|nr:preprotein translocase subunit YajC [Isosphaeraceae bacterium]
MPGLFADLPFLIAAGAKAQQAGSPLTGMLLPMVSVGLLFYLLILRPNQIQERKRREELNALKKNDRVLTTAGIYGTVVSVDPEADKVVLRVDDSVKLTFSRASITKIIDVSADKDKEKDKDKDKEKASQSA